MLCLHKVALCTETDGCPCSFYGGSEIKFTGAFSELVSLLPTYKNRTGTDEGKKLAWSWICHVDASAESLIKVFGWLFKVLAVSKKGSVILSKH